ncbi:MAG: inorganic diphosphatase [Clostridium sp.]|uniref:inorganic diphosphatase n=1 Tax=Clostridium sp. TaxID=1506 RepID=UPI003F2CCF7A
MRCNISKYLGEKVNIIIDRKLGSSHPKYDYIYTLNYGFVPNTVSGDGEEIDAYIIGEFEPLEDYEGYVVAIINREDDIEDKLVVCKEVGKYDEKQIAVLVEFQERFFKSEIILNK